MMTNCAPTRWTRAGAFSKLGCAALLCTAAGLGYAADTGCSVVFNAMLRAAATPYHSFTSLQMGGQSMSSEMISDGKKMYLLNEGKWTLSSLTPQNLIDQEKENIKNNKTVCSVVRDEVIDGVDTTKYTTREQEDGGTTTAGEIWISKTTGLPVHIKSDVPSSTRYVYSGVTAPPIS